MEREGIVAEAGGKAPEQIGRGDVLEVDLAAVFGAGGVLALSSGLLHAFVGDDVTNFAAGDGEAEFVAF